MRVVVAAATAAVYSYTRTDEILSTHNRQCESISWAFCYFKQVGSQFDRRLSKKKKVQAERETNCVATMYDVIYK